MRSGAAHARAHAVPHQRAHIGLADGRATARRGPAGSRAIAHVGLQRVGGFDGSASPRPRVRRRRDPRAASCSRGDWRRGRRCTRLRRRRTVRATTSAPEVRFHAAHHVVRGRANGIGRVARSRPRCGRPRQSSEIAPDPRRIEVPSERYTAAPCGLLARSRVTPDPAAQDRPALSYRVMKRSPRVQQPGAFARRASDSRKRGAPGTSARSDGTARTRGRRRVRPQTTPASRRRRWRLADWWSR